MKDLRTGRHDEESRSPKRVRAAPWSPLPNGNFDDARRSIRAGFPGRQCTGSLRITEPSPKRRSDSSALAQPPGRGGELAAPLNGFLPKTGLHVQCHAARRISPLARSSGDPASRSFPSGLASPPRASPHGRPSRGPRVLRRSPSGRSIAAGRGGSETGSARPGCPRSK